MVVRTVTDKVTRRLPVKAAGTIRPRQALATALGAVAVLAIAAYFAYGRGFVNGDTMWALTWGDQLAHLQQPTFTADTPTPHPLLNVTTALLSPLGQAAEPAWHVIGYLSLGAMLYATWLLGAALFGPWAGLIAVALVATRETVTFYGPLAYLDFPYTALVVWAAALEARTRRRGTPVLVLLTIAGLLRPEAWLLAGLYWLWLLPALSRRRAAGALMLVAIAPLLWGLFDLATTGNPVFSFSHTTQAGMEDRAHGLHDLITQAPRLLGQQLRPALVIAAAIGYLLALWYRMHGVWLVAATAATVVAFSLPVAAGTVANPRYMLPTIVLMCVAAAACLAGWSAVVGRPRLVWQAGAIAGVLALLITAPSHVERAARFPARHRHLPSIVGSIPRRRDRPDTVPALDVRKSPPLPDGRFSGRRSSPTSSESPLTGHRRRAAISGAPERAMTGVIRTRQRCRSSRAAAAGYPGRLDGRIAGRFASGAPSMESVVAMGSPRRSTAELRCFN